MKKFNIVNIKEIITEELENDERLQLACINAKKEEIFEEIYEDIRLEYIKNKILYIRVKNSIINHYMYTNKNKILEKINNISDIIIDNIQIELR